MSKYSCFRYDFTASIKRLAEINDVLLLLKNAIKKRNEPVPKHVTNPCVNINLSYQMSIIAYQRYNVALDELKAANIVPIDWLPTFEELKSIAETADNFDL